MPAAMGRASRLAVRADNCLGDRFLVEGMDHKLQKHFRQNIGSKNNVLSQNR
jgi:hypothetical protein